MLLRQWVNDDISSLLEYLLIYLVVTVVISWFGLLLTLSTETKRNS